MVFSVPASSLSGSDGVNARFEVTRVIKTIRAVTRYKVYSLIFLASQAVKQFALLLLYRRPVKNR